MPAANASSAISRRDGAKPAGSWRFVMKSRRNPKESEQPEQYQLFDTPEYTYRVFVTNMDGSLDTLVWFYNQRAGAENLIKEANNDAGLTAHPSNRWTMNDNWFQIAMLAYNLNCWLHLFNREEDTKVAAMKHTECIKKSGGGTVRVGWKYE
jgi:hypothetical protein